ncbi:MAG: hypothetical protein KGL39_22015 [Patescibacteria group bacterium]|nr:hypothetical protein [Patescibacteria group bacterium]
MEVIVHVPFHLNGRIVARGETLSGVDAEIVHHDPLLMARCSVTPHSAFVAPKRKSPESESPPPPPEDAKPQ